MSFIRQIFDTSDFPARWNCGDWSTAHGWMHIVSDFAIAAAYAVIPCMLAYFILRRRDTPFLPIFWLFAAFILSCGLGHLVEGLMFWHPWYRFSAVVKVCVAVTSWITVAVLIPTIPRALNLPGLATVNARLSDEVNERQSAERQLQASHDEMQRFTSNVLDREERMIELKQEVNELLRAQGQEPLYDIPATPHS